LQLPEFEAGKNPHQHPPPLPPHRCIEWIKISTNRTNSIALGNDRSASELRASTINRKGGFLATVRGYEDYLPGQPVTKGPLQQLQFVWGIGVCPEAAQPKAAPSSSVLINTAPAPPAAEPPPAESIALPSAADDSSSGAGGQLEAGPAVGFEQAPTPPMEAPRSEEELCPAKKSQCDASATSGAAYCPVIAPFTEPACSGGCCISAGKCKRGFCGKVGLGAEVFARDLFCWGVNAGPLFKLNRCRNLACKLAVPGCVGDLISGACVGSVVALSADLHAGARQWVGYPCLQTVPGGLPVNALGKMDLNGAYAAKL